MEIIRCEKGHFYDADKHACCPNCAAEMGGSRDSGLGGMMDAGIDMRGGMDAGILDTSFFGGDTDIGVTTAIRETIGSTTAIGSVNGGGSATNQNFGGSEIEEYGATEAANVFAVDTATNETKGVFNPVVGWLVCIKGASRGADFQIHSQYNYIGRAKHMDICIPSDRHISAEKAAVLAYDNNEKVFFFAPGSGHNLVRVNGSVVMAPVKLEAYDIVTIGETQLLFVPLCGDHFDWNNQ